MSTAEHQPQEFPPDPLELATTALEITESAYLSQLERWAKLPVRSRLLEVKQAGQVYKNSFLYAADMIINDSHSDIDIKANMLSRVFLQCDERRTTVHKKLCPKGDFVPFPATPEVVSAAFADYLRQDATGTHAFDQVSGNFAMLMIADSKELRLSLPAFERMERASKAAVDIAKIAAGAYIGGLLAARSFANLQSRNDVQP